MPNCIYFQPVAYIPVETTAALILHDFAQFLGLGAQQREKVLGRSATAFVDALLDERIDMR